MKAICCKRCTETRCNLVGRRVRLESWHNAQSHAEAAARSMCGQRVPYSPVPYNWSQQFDMNIQIAGFIDRSETMFRRGGPDADGGLLSLYSDGRRLVGAVAVNRPRDLRVVQHLIEKQTDIAGLNLADEGVSLKALLRAAAE
jgi:3-phenylpropionate/trans-cinnamate dioxygenase ferredoxin reductase subunit